MMLLRAAFVGLLLAVASGEPLRQPIKEHVVDVEQHKIIRRQVESELPDRDKTSWLEIKSHGFQVRKVGEAEDVPDATNADAYEVVGAGTEHFNGVYMPSTMPNPAATKCTGLVWDLAKDGKFHFMYNTDGAWVLGIRTNGQAVQAYNGADGGVCSPETITWTSVNAAYGAQPSSVIKRVAADITTAAPTTAAPTATTAAPTAVNGGPASTDETMYMLVEGSGIQLFDGVYYKTALDVVDQGDPKQPNSDCHRTWAKDGSTNTEYILFFRTPNWVFQSDIAGVKKRPYMGSDNGQCQPNATFAEPPAGTAISLNPNLPTAAASPGGGVRPTVVCPPKGWSPFTTTTTTTAVIVVVVANTTAAPARVWINVTDSPVVEGNTTTAAPVSTTNTDYDIKAKGNQGFSRWWLPRVVLPLSLVLALKE